MPTSTDPPFCNSPSCPPPPDLGWLDEFVCEGLIVEVARKSEERDEFADLLVANLAAHKVAARYQHFVVDEISVMDTLLSAVSDHAADLLTIGAFDSGANILFGHGAGTRHILAHMTAPVLFSH